jgi:hypothetical protein
MRSRVFDRYVHHWHLAHRKHLWSFGRPSGNLKSVSFLRSSARKRLIHYLHKFLAPTFITMSDEELVDAIEGPYALIDACYRSLPSHSFPNPLPEPEIFARQVADQFAHLFSSTEALCQVGYGDVRFHCQRYDKAPS